MATQAAEVRSERVVVLMTPTEKRAITDRAREAGLSLGEYMRLAAEFGALSPVEQAELEALAAALETSRKELEESFTALEAASSRVVDEEALRAKYRAEFEAMDVDWASVAERLGLARSGLHGNI